MLCSWGCPYSHSLDNKAVKWNGKVSAVVLILYSINRFLWKPIAPDNFFGYLCRCHLNDYLGAIVFMAYTNILISLFMDPKKQIVRLLPTLLMGVLCAFWWEWLAPKFLIYSTADFGDAVAYLLGSATYWGIQKLQKILSSPSGAQDFLPC